MRQRYAREVSKRTRRKFDRQWEAVNGAILRSDETHLAKIAEIKWMDWTKYQGQSLPRLD